MNVIISIRIKDNRAERFVLSVRAFDSASHRKPSATTKLLGTARFTFSGQNSPRYTLDSARKRRRGEGEREMKSFDLYKLTVRFN